MEMTFDELLKFWKGIDWQRVETSNCICTGPCFVFGAQIVSDGDGEADGGVYDGHNASGKKAFDLMANDEEMDSLSFNPPLFFSQGIYVEKGTTCMSIMVQFLPVKD